MRDGAIETEYNGYRFRSRTEARWAVFFDKLGGVKYEYEKEGYDLGGVRYLPDFWLPQLDCWLEIKGTDPTVEELYKLYNLILYTQRQNTSTGAWGHMAIGPPSLDSPLLTFMCIPYDPLVPQEFRAAESTDYIIFAEHLYRPPGRVFYAVEEPYYKLARLNEPPNERTLAAYAAARSARFEHGEHGGIAPARPIRTLPKPQLPPPIQVDATLKAGDRVRHPTFGLGIVVLPPSERVITVAFAGQGVKRLDTHLAILEKI